MSRFHSFDINFLMLLLLYSEIDKGTGICTNPPSVTGYSRPHGTSVSSYKFTWKSARCQDGTVIQYQLQFAESCSTTLPITVITGSNATSTIIVIPSCSAMDCYVRVRGELLDGSFTDYSACVLINNQLVEHERPVQQYFQDVCVPIQGECDTGSVSEFFINDHSTLWPSPASQPYNITYSLTSRTHSFCFTNITEPITIIEYCYQHHSAGCSLCSLQSGEVVFKSRSEIFVPLPSLPETHNYSVRSTEAPHTRSVVNLSMTTAASSSTTIVPYNKLNDMNVTENTFPIILAGVLVGTVCVLILTTLLSVLITLRCQRRSRETDNTTSTCLFVEKSKQSNIYDEHSFPDPVYHKGEVKLSTST